MTKYNSFKEHIKEAAARFKTIDKKETIRVISHLDSDGICAASILINALKHENRKYIISIVQNLDKDIIAKLQAEKYNYYVFTDIGSGQLNTINSLLTNKKVFILDHHSPESEKTEKNITHVNPHLFEIDGGKEISGSGVVYFFSKFLTNKILLPHIAIIGAIGDVQEEDGFMNLNNEILEEAIKLKKIKKSRGLRVFGAHTKPLHKILEYCSDPKIPGVSGSESGAIQFLQEIGIESRKGNEWKKIIDLSQDEIKKLTAAIILRRADMENPENILSNRYVLVDEEKGTTFRTVKEFSTLLNACGRMKKPSIGIGVCLDNKSQKKKALKVLADYKKEIVNAIRWYKSNSDKIIKDNNFIIINAEENIQATVIGTLASIISKSNDLKEGTFILSLARNSKNTTKASLRIMGNGNADLKKIMTEICIDIENSEAGGHMEAAGAVLPTEKEKEFIDKAVEVLKKYS